MNATEAVIHITRVHGGDSLSPQGHLASSARSLMALQAFRLHFTHEHNPSSGLQAIPDMWLPIRAETCLLPGGGPRWAEN